MFGKFASLSSAASSSDTAQLSVSTGIDDWSRLHASADVEVMIWRFGLDTSIPMSRCGPAVAETAEKVWDTVSFLVTCEGSIDLVDDRGRRAGCLIGQIWWIEEEGGRAREARLGENAGRAGGHWTHLNCCCWRAGGAGPGTGAQAQVAGESTCTGWVEPNTVELKPKAMLLTSESRRVRALSPPSPPPPFPGLGYRRRLSSRQGTKGRSISDGRMKGLWWAGLAHSRMIVSVFHRQLSDIHLVVPCWAPGEEQGGALWW